MLVLKEVFMNLYHGSYMKIEKPILNFSNKNGDFGPGFYLTSDFEQASSWAVKKVAKLEQGNPTVSIYNYNENNNDLKIKKFTSADEEWFEYVVNNRKNLTNDNYDIVEGPVANDGTYEVINLYIRGILTKKQAISRLKTYKLKDQLNFKTDKAISKLTFEGVEKI